MAKPVNRRKLAKAFKDFNFDLVNADPMPLIILLLNDPVATSAFEKFLLSKKKLSSRDTHLILSYLSQTDFLSTVLIKSLRKSEQMREIIDTFQKATLSLSRPGYFGLSSTKILRLVSIPDAIEQIRQRRLRESEYEYSVALNHLLNEFHAICYSLDVNKGSLNKYDANKVITFLINKGVPTSTYMPIRSLFDRRNKNVVSHPDPVAWVVDEVEYFKYRDSVGKCLACIL